MQPLFLEVTVFPAKAKRGEFTVKQKKKSRELFEEKGHNVNVPPDVGDQEKRALAQKGKEATGSW